MPLDIALPWLRPPDLVGAASEGAQAGLGAARIALQAEQMHQQNQQEGARLSQQEHIAQMEAQTRQEIAQQNQLRESQRLAIEQAYQNAQIGMAKGRLEQQQAVAAAKAKEAAASFQRDQAFSADLASGMSVIDAYKRNPVSAETVNALSRVSTKEQPDTKPIIREGRFPIVKVNPVTGENNILYTPPTDTTKLTEIQKENLIDARHQRTILEKAQPKSAEEASDIKDKLDALNYSIEKIKRGKSLTPPPITPPDRASSTTKSKVDRAHEISAQHPDWTKEQVVKAVNDELQ